MVHTRPGNTYFDLWGSGRTDVYAAACGDSSEVARFDGQSWSRVTSACAFGIAGFPSGGMYVGEAFGNLLRGVGPRGTIGDLRPSLAAAGQRTPLVSASRRHSSTEGVSSTATLSIAVRARRPRTTSDPGNALRPPARLQSTP